MATTEKRPITAEDLYGFQLITDCHLSPGGEHVLFAQSRVDRKTEKKYSNLWVVPAEGGEVRQFTFGDQVDGRPRWSPDGAEIAFVSNRADPEQPQIYLIPFSGGEARRLTDFKGEIGSYEWSPKGSRLVVQLRKKDQEAIEREQDDQKKKLGVVARHITRGLYKLDGYGYLPEERWHLWTVDVQTGQAAQITAGPVHDEVSPRWSPDGTKILFCSNRSEDPDADRDAVDLFTIPAAGGEMRRIEAPVGTKALPSFSPDGRWIAYVGREGRKREWRNASLWVVSAGGGEPARNLTGAHDLHVAGGTLTDLGEAAQRPPTWSRDGKALYFQVAHHGNTHLLSVPLAGGEPRTVVGDDGAVGSFEFDREQTKLAYFHGEMRDPGQVWARDMATAESRRLTRTNQPLLESLDLAAVDEVWFKGSSGNDLQGWIMKPPGFDESRQWPSILYIHGGPLAQYGNFFMHEFNYLAARGYVVCFCNPRGGRGYGEAHAGAIYQAWGTVDYEDLMAWADYLERKPYIDRERMGVAGGSYGGYMTNWIIGHTHRFRAAVTTRSVSNFLSMWGSSDLNWEFEEDCGDAPPWEKLQQYWDRSPMKYLGNARTPTKVLHNQQDLRCALEQGEQVYVALKKQGVDTELVIFPDEPHGLSRTGRTDRRIARLNHILDWFERYLKK